MKQIVFSILVIAGLLAFVYTGRVQKAVAVNRVRLKARLVTGEITRRQYDEAMASVSFGSMFLDPRAVLAVD
jgi:vancomycin permeability regulator SanA